jgi:hypothetical protein
MKLLHKLALAAVGTGLAIALTCGTRYREPTLPRPPVVAPAQQQGPKLEDLLADVRRPLEQDDYAAAAKALERIPADATPSRYVLEAFLALHSKPGREGYTAAAEEMLGIDKLIRDEPRYLERIHAELGPHQDLAGFFQSPHYRSAVETIRKGVDKFGWLEPSLYRVQALCFLFQREPDRAADIYRDHTGSSLQKEYRTMLATLRDSAQRHAETATQGERAGWAALRATYAAALERLE